MAKEHVPSSLTLALHGMKVPDVNNDKNDESVQVKKQNLVKKPEPVKEKEIKSKKPSTKKTPAKSNPESQKKMELVEKEYTSVEKEDFEPKYVLINLRLQPMVVQYIKFRSVQQGKMIKEYFNDFVEEILNKDTKIDVRLILLSDRYKSKKQFVVGVKPENINKLKELEKKYGVKVSQLLNYFLVKTMEADENNPFPKE